MKKWECECGDWHEEEQRLCPKEYGIIDLGTEVDIPANLRDSFINAASYKIVQLGDQRP